MAIVAKDAEERMQSNLEHELEAELEGEFEFEGELEHEHGEHEFEAELEHEHGEHEFEGELEHEHGEHEFEGELEHEHGEHEFEGELEHEHGEHEFEAELEHEHGEHEFEGELEHEHGEHEFEGEGELEAEGGFLGSVVSGLSSLLGEGEGELEHEHGEQFFGRAFRGIGRLVQRAAPILRSVARVAAPIVGKVVAGALPGPFGALASQGLNALLSEHEHEHELGEHEHEHEHELSEHEVSHELGEHEAMAEAMAHYAAQAEHELEAEAMVGAATTVTISRRDRRALRRLVPHLVRGAAILTRILRLRRRTRPIVRVVPTIIRRTVRALSRSAAAGRPITRRRAGAIMARQTRRVLSSPRYCAAVLRRNVRASRAVIRPRALRRRRGAV
jgi:hypothetical protein